MRNTDCFVCGWEEREHCFLPVWILSLSHCIGVVPVRVGNRNYRAWPIGQQALFRAVTVLDLNRRCVSGSTYSFSIPGAKSGGGGRVGLVLFGLRLDASSPPGVAFPKFAHRLCCLDLHNAGHAEGLHISASQLEVRTASFLQEFGTQLECLHEPCLSGRGFVTCCSRKQAALTSRQISHLMLWRLMFPGKSVLFLEEGIWVGKITYVVASGTIVAPVSAGTGVRDPQRQ